MAPRRYYLLKSYAAQDVDDDLWTTWRAKQEAVAGTALPSDFPSRARLVAARYSTVEDIDGAVADELAKNVGLTLLQSQAVVTAVEALAA